MKRTLFLMIIVGVLAFLGTISSRLPLILRAATSGERSEFTASLVKVSYRPDGTEGLRDTLTFAAKRDGSSATLRRRAVPDGTGGIRQLDLADVVDLQQRRIVGIDHFTKSISTSPIPDPQFVNYRLKPDSTCTSSFIPKVPAVSEVGGMLLGQKTLKVTQERIASTPDGEGRMTIERWYAPDLDCFVLKEAMSSSIMGRPAGRSTTDATSLSIGPPDAALFQIPDYPERSPGEIFAEEARIIGQDCKACTNSGTKTLDDAYRRRRGKR